MTRSPSVLPVLAASLFVSLVGSAAGAQDILPETIVPPEKAETPEQPPRKKAFNEFDLGFTTIRMGAAFIHEYAAYSQDDAGKAQMDAAGVELTDQHKFRDFRYFANGRLNTKRQLIWKVAAMYDGAEDSWTFRETGLLIGVPELKGHIFLGRSKEGYSLYKVQNGYSTWGNERQMSLDLIPIMTDGIHFYGYAPGPRVFWYLGGYSNFIYGSDSKFMLWDWTYAARLGWRPLYDKDANKVVHLGVNYRYARPDEDEIQVRSRPESNPAPYFIDTGVFETDRSQSYGYEAYYSQGKWLVGSEGNRHTFRSETANDPKFWGLDVTATYLFTGEIRPYLSDTSAFHFVYPRKSIFDGGLGAWELVMRYSVFDTNDGLKPGGKFWKVTPMINWYPSKNFRLELVYGYGKLDRFGLEGKTQFFQTRFQFQLL